MFLSCAVVFFHGFVAVHSTAVAEVDNTGKGEEKNSKNRVEGGGGRERDEERGRSEKERGHTITKAVRI